MTKKGKYLSRKFEFTDDGLRSQPAQGNVEPGVLHSHGISSVWQFVVACSNDRISALNSNVDFVHFNMLYNNSAVTLSALINVPTHKQATIPGDTFCELSVMDQDLVGSDDLIGSTRIDIENRWLNEKWKVKLVFF